MNDAKNIYSSRPSEAISLTICEAKPAAARIKTVLARVASLLYGPDLDLGTFERIESKSQSSERNITESIRHMAGRL